MNKTLTSVVGALAALTLLGACGDDDKKSSGGDYCARMVAYKAKADAMDIDFTTATPDEVKTAFETMAAATHDMQNGAPSEIADDVKAQAAAVDQMVAIFEKYDWDMAAQMSDEDTAALTTLFGSAELTAATDNLDAYMTDTCGVTDTEG